MSSISGQLYLYKITRSQPRVYDLFKRVAIFLVTVLHANLAKCPYPIPGIFVTAALLSVQYAVYWLRACALAHLYRGYQVLRHACLQRTSVENHVESMTQQIINYGHSSFFSFLAIWFLPSPECRSSSRQRHSQCDCMGNRAKISRTVPCCVIYSSCTQMYTHCYIQFLLAVFYDQL